MTELKTDRDLVELLRQRLQQARRENSSVHDSSGLTDGQFADLTNGLSFLIEALQGDNVTDVPAVQAVARALVGEIGSHSTEWCVFVGDHPESTEHRMVGLSRGDAEVLRRRINARDFVPGSLLESVFCGAEGPARVARRTAWTTTGHSSWQVVATESGEPS